MWPASADAGHDDKRHDVVTWFRLLRAQVHNRRPEIEFEVGRLLKTKLERLGETRLGHRPGRGVQERLHRGPAFALPWHRDPRIDHSLGQFERRSVERRDPPRQIIHEGVQVRIGKGAVDPAIGRGRRRVEVVGAAHTISIARARPA